MDSASHDTELLRLEIQKLKSKQVLLEDTMKENEALHRDKSATAKTITDLKEKLIAVTDLEVKLKAKTEDLDELTRKHESAVELSNRRAAEITKGVAERSRLKQQVDQQAVELKKYRDEDKKQGGCKRKLMEYLKDVGVTKDDFETEGDTLEKAAKLRRQSRPHRDRPMRLLGFDRDEEKRVGAMPYAATAAASELSITNVRADVSVEQPQTISVTTDAPISKIPRKVHSQTCSNGFANIIEKHEAANGGTKSLGTPRDTYAGYLRERRTGPTLGDTRNQGSGV